MKCRDHLVGQITTILQAWYDEVKDYNFSYGGFAMNTGHFTQLVWRDTVKVAFYVVF